MKRLSFILATTFTWFFVNGQSPDVTESNCDNQNESVYAELNSGKSLLVVASGFDCGICVSEAPSVASWTNDHQDEIAVWGAMHYKYSSAEPTCNELNNWVSNYEWDNLFVFLDTNNNTKRYWTTVGYPYYQVIDPTNKEVAYAGTSFFQAKQVALEKSQITALTEWKAPSNALDFTIQGRQLSTSSSQQAGTFYLYDTLGKVILEKSTSNNENIDLSSVPSGQLYFGVLKSADNVISKRIIFE